MSVAISGTTVTFPDSSTITSGWTGFKNRIINGAMVIDQRNAGASVTPTDGQYTLDRWAVVATQASKFTVQQNAGSVTPPGGFTKYLGFTSSSAYTPVSTDIIVDYQWIEGYNVADLAMGTANAKSFTISLYDSVVDGVTIFLEISIKINNIILSVRFSILLLYHGISNLYLTSLYFLLSNSAVIKS